VTSVEGAEGRGYRVVADHDEPPDCHG